MFPVRVLGRMVAAVVLALLVAASAWASIRKIELTRANQATSPVTFTLTMSEASNERVAVRLEMPRDQAPLEHLWRIDLRRREGAGLHALQTTLMNGRLVTDVALDVTEAADAEIWIRTGPAAPASETVYIIKVGTFR